MSTPTAPQLGYLLDLDSFQLKVDRLFAVIAIHAAIGAAGYLALDGVDCKLVFWCEDRM